MPKGVLVQGVILNGMQKMVRERFGAAFWHTIESDTNIVGRVYLPMQSYPSEELQAVVESVSRHSGMSVPLVLESIGDYVAPDVLAAYASIVEPRWSLLDMLVHVEEIVERAASRQGDELVASPLSGRPSKDGEVILIYQSPLHLCALVKGLVSGLGSHMDQPVSIEEMRCMLKGSAACEFVIKAERTADRIRALRRRATPSKGIAAAGARDGSSERGDRVSSLPSLSSLPPSSGSRAESHYPPRKSWLEGERPSVPPPSRTLDSHVGRSKLPSGFELDETAQQNDPTGIRRR